MSPKRLSIRSIITENPRLTLEEVGQAVGTSREYVRQVVVMDRLQRIKHARHNGKPVKV